MGKYTRFFSFGELWTGGQGGWPCQMKKSCKRLSNVIALTAREAGKLNRAICRKRPEAIWDGQATGPEAAAYILKNRLGVVVCYRHEE